MNVTYSQDCRITSAWVMRPIDNDRWTVEPVINGMKLTPRLFDRRDQAEAYIKADQKLTRAAIEQTARDIQRMLGKQ